MTTLPTGFASTFGVVGIVPLFAHRLPLLEIVQL